MRRITLVRRIVQTLSFALIVYGGFVFVRPLDPNEVVDEVTGYAGKYDVGRSVRVVYRERSRLDLNLPATSCYYQHKGLFSGCSLAFISEHLTWLTPLVTIAPQLLLVVVMMFAVGRLWCGWICPYGAASDLLSGLRKLLGGDHLLLPRRVRDGLVWTKYALLALTVAVSLVAALPALERQRSSLLLAFCQVCPGKIVAPLLSDATICWTDLRDAFTTTLTVLGLLALGMFLAGLVVRRSYCRICPIGGLTAPFNRYGLVSIHKTISRCTSCGACARVCPVDNLSVLDGRDGPVDACECTLCLRCVEACPEPGCLEFTFLGKPIVRS